ncbi:MAG: AAA family ATPase [Clostridiales bacterium]|nr:AAA family ATPase [Clostridiales bacterium]
MMKNLILICGASGIGKSTACKALTEVLPNTAFIDSDYCRYMNPFGFTQEEIQIVVSNISNMMINYFACSTIENVIFQYGFHGVREQIFSVIIEVVNAQNIEYNFCPIILQCSLEESIRRMVNDNRDEARIQRAIENTRHIYDAYTYPKINITDLSVRETCFEIMEVLREVYHIVEHIEAAVHNPSTETQEALAEVEEMKKILALGKAYTDVDEMIQEMLAE